MNDLNDRRPVTLFVLLLLCIGMSVAAAPDPARAAGRRGGENLLVNPGAEVGTFSVQGWDSVTIPGWRVGAGLPTVVRYRTKGLPRTGGSGRQLFVGGAGGTARLSQHVSLRTPSGRRLKARARYRLSAALGGTATSAASVIVRFLSRSGRPLGQRAIGPVGERRSDSPDQLITRSSTGVLPARAVDATVTLVLSTSLRDVDGPDAPKVGYDRAVADDVSFTIDRRVIGQPELTPPAAHVPRFDHVFLFYFENEDFRAVIGNRSRAPYFNSLLPRASLLADFFAEEHPSDGNYLALAGGSVFGIPLDDPLEENPRYTIDARNLGDLIHAAHETWKGYLQSAAGPCDDTVHGYYWNDDLPLLYFSDVRNRPAYCAAHLVPLESLTADLSSAATTPNFAWVSPDDCSDMEGCGIRAGDDFLARELGSILRSQAWRTQRSLAIITFDEDDYDHQRPAQRVPTLVIGSTGTRQGYVSHVRYTHYSLLRTIEGALGLTTLTRNDLFAQPTNDVFDTVTAHHAERRHLAASPPRRAASIARRRGPTAFVVNSTSASVTPVALRSRKAGRPIRVGADPNAIALSPDGRTAYVVNGGSDSVTPIDTVTRRAGRPIAVGDDPRAIAVTASGRTVYVVNSGSDSVTPIDTTTGKSAAPIPAGVDPRAIALTRGGRTAYVLDWGGSSVTPIDTATNRAEPAIPVGSFPAAIAIAPDGQTAYVANYGSDTVTPIAVAGNQAGRAIRVGIAPNSLAVTPNGRTVEVVDGDSDEVTPIATSTERPGRPIRVGYSPTALTVGPTGTAYVVNTISGSLTPIATNNEHAGRAISVGTYSYPLTVALAPEASTAVVLDTYAGEVTLVNTRSRRHSHPIKVGGFPLAVAITS